MNPNNHALQPTPRTNELPNLMKAEDPGSEMRHRKKKTKNRITDGPKASQPSTRGHSVQFKTPTPTAWAGGLEGGNFFGFGGHF